MPAPIPDPDDILDHAKAVADEHGIPVEAIIGRPPTDLGQRG